MNAIEQAEELRKQAIKVLLEEQDLLQKKLLEFGHDPENSQVGKRRGRRPKVVTEQAPPVSEIPLLEGVVQLSTPSGAPAQTVKNRAQ